MKQKAVEFLVEQIKKDLNLRLRGFDIDGIEKQAKEIEKEQQGYSEVEVKKLIIDFLFTKGIGKEVESVNEWFEQFKNK